MRAYRKSILRFSSDSVTKLQPTQGCMAMEIVSLLTRSRWKIARDMKACCVSRNLRLLRLCAGMIMGRSILCSCLGEGQRLN